MSKYLIEIVPKAEKEFLKLTESIQVRVRKKVLLLENNPRPFGCKKLKETKYYRLRVGDYRAIYHIDDSSKIVTVLSIAHRKEVYK